MRNSPYLVVLLFGLSCSTEKEVVSKMDEKEKVVIAELGEMSINSSNFSISSVEVIENNMIVEVSYSGGCKIHDYKMIGSSMIAKSLPPIRSIKLIDSTTDDLCKKMEIKKIKIDISALAYKKEKGSEIYLTLEGWTSKIKYVFV